MKVRVIIDNGFGALEAELARHNRVFAVMDEPLEDKSGSENMEQSKGTIIFDHVNFSYEPGKQVLHDFCFEVKNGHKIALVGSTGSGKTSKSTGLTISYNIKE